MLADLKDLTKQAATGDGRGGRRPNSGRKKKDGSPNASAKVVESSVEVRSVEQLLDSGPPPPMLSATDTDMGRLSFSLPDNPVALYAGAKARKEVALAAKAELDFRIRSGAYLPRDAVRSASAKAFQAVAQALRSIPDNLERKLGIDPTIAEFVGTAIDEAMGELAHELEQVFLQANGLPTGD